LLTRSEGILEGISPEAAKALTELDGETPLSIAAERLKTIDLRRFLEEVAFLEQRKMVELVTPSQAVVVRYTSALQALLTKVGNIIGFHTTREIFFASRDRLVDNYPWLAFVTLEEGVDIEMRSSLLSATLKGSIAPDILDDGLRVLVQFITRRIKDFMGKDPVNRILMNTKNEIEYRFPSTVYHIEWETFQV
jgi:hypothetical protein